MADNIQEPGVVFSVEKLYIKDASYESPNVPYAFTETQGQPQLQVQMIIERKALNEAEGMYEVVLAVTATAKFQETTIFLAEAQQAGLFRVVGVPPQDLPKVLEISCPGILLPFVREVINDMVTKGGFPQLLVNPVNFEALYMQKYGAPQQQAGNL
ncbi:MAG: protein-export chaperone SecB [Gammaproteobacteria bacterium]|nr:protein-export chaperone SecB [Gammaproteobacteria bacterium]